MTENRSVLTTIVVAATTAVIASLATQAAIETADAQGGVVTMTGNVVWGIDNWTRAHVALVSVLALLPIALTTAFLFLRWNSGRRSSGGGIEFVGGQATSGWLTLAWSWAAAAVLVLLTPVWDGPVPACLALALLIFGGVQVVSAVVAVFRPYQ